MTYKILHVDDDRYHTELVRRLLHGSDYEVYAAHDAQTALHMFHEHLPHAALVDINMPVTNGVELAATVRADAALRHIPLIALTANAMIGDREYYLANNFDAYLAKPVLRLELMQVLAQVRREQPSA